jgi:hypothetical protein
MQADRGGVENYCLKTNQNYIGIPKSLKGVGAIDPKQRQKHADYWLFKGFLVCSVQIFLR